MDWGDDIDDADRVPSEGALESGVNAFKSVTTDVVSVAIVTASVSTE